MLGSLFLTGLALCAPLVRAADDDEPEYEDMGPAAFMWPPDRVWSAAADNTAPCGSVNDPTDRTDFPLEKGALALVAQDESWKIELSISYEENPKSNNDFKMLIDPDHFDEMDLGHTCVDVVDQPDSVAVGDVATFQVKYLANFDTPENQTFYACADVKFVAVADFNLKSIPCFNATGDADSPYDPHDELDLDDDDDEEAAETTTSGGSQPSSSADDDDDNEDGNTDESTDGGSSGGGGLSGGAIAGIVVGALAGVALIAGAGFIVYRRKQRGINAARQQSTARGVKWENRDAQAGSVSSDSVRMQNLPA